MTETLLKPGDMSLRQLETIYWSNGEVAVDHSCRAGVEVSAAVIAEAAGGEAPIYGVNTGFGKLASVKIAPRYTAALQKNLILSHCCGVGPAVPERIVRLMMILKLLSLCRGASGVRWELIVLLEQMLARKVTPVIPAQG